MFRLNLSHIQDFDNPQRNHNFHPSSSQAFDNSNYSGITSIFCVVYLGFIFFYCVNFFSWLDNTQWARAFLIIEASRSHSDTHHTRKDSSRRVISPLQRHLPHNTQHSQETDIHDPRPHSNPQSQPTNGCRPPPQTARPLGSDFGCLSCCWLCVI